MAEHEKALRTAEKALCDRRMVMHRSLLGYLYDLITHTSLYTKWQSFLSILRRFRAVSFSIKLLTILFSILETGALVILSTVLFLIILPMGSMLMLGILLTALLESKRTNKRLAARLAGKPIYILFLRDGDANSFQVQNARELATRGIVLLVSPYWISAKGIYPHGFYCTVRHEAPNIFLVRRYYFFSLRRRVLGGLDTVYMY